jgi:hypothetical protein
MRVTLSGMRTAVSLLQELKAFRSMLVTGFSA